LLPIIDVIAERYRHSFFHSVFEKTYATTQKV